MSFIAELKRRNVFRVGIAYLVGAWLLIQVSDILLDNIGAPAWVLQALFVMLGVGFFIATFFAWAFELTPEGVKRENEVDRSQSITPQTGKKLNNTILVLMALAIGYLLFDKFTGSGSSTGTSVEAVSQADGKPVSEPGPIEPAAAATEPVITKQSIAVLPFSNRSNREEDQFFTDGIHDDLLTTIARIGSMKVISRTSVMEYKDTTKKIPEIAKELGVANILEGGIQRSGNQVRINVQLIDAATDEHLWAETFDRELTAENLFAIQSEISHAIADALQATLSPREQQSIDTMPTNNLAAYDAYLRGRQLMATRDSKKLEQAIDEFNKAVELDPKFALAWVGVADSSALSTSYGTLENSEALRVRQKAIDQALEINPNLGEAYTSKGSLLQDLYQLEQAEAAYKRAIELSPNYATAYHWYSSLLSDYPLRLDEAIALTQKAAELDPRSSIIGSTLASMYGSRGLYSMTERQYQKVIELDPEFAQGYNGLAGHYLHNVSNLELALKYALQAVSMDPGNISNLFQLFNVYRELGDTASAQTVRERMADLDANSQWGGFADVLIAVEQKNPGSTREAINWWLPKIEQIPFALHFAALLTLSQSEIQFSREIYLMANPGWTDPDQWQRLIALYKTDACVVSWILLNTGDEDLGAALLKQATIFLDESLPAAMEHAETFNPEVCYLTSGDTEKALQSVETQLAHNHLIGWKVVHQLPMYDAIRFEPRYQAAVAERERRIALQREAIAKMDAGAGS